MQIGMGKMGMSSGEFWSMGFYEFWARHEGQFGRSKGASAPVSREDYEAMKEAVAKYGY